MRGAWLAILLGASTTAIAQPALTGAIAPPLSPRNASYTIRARLDTGGHTITGTEVIAWRNITAKPATELRFHLYWNAWRDDGTTYMRELALAGAQASPAHRADADRSRIDVTALRLTAPSAADLTASQHVLAPDDGNPDDRTVMAVPLPEPIPPGGSATLELAWTAHVPRPVSRTGVIGRFYFIAQWFPKLGVLQDEGWNCHQFHASTEFFSDYGTYDVTLTVPQGWPVGATGVERERRDNPDGTSTHRFYQDDVHDFAWTTSPDFVERTAMFDRPPLPAVAMRLLLQPEHAGQADRHFAAARVALQDYGEWYGAYPYGHITIVDPAYQSAAGGMEYPTLFTAGTRWLAPSGATTPESVIIHEAGHQWWYGMVGSNEFEDAWMDEGFNQFSEARATEQRYTPHFFVQRYFGGFVPFVFRDIELTRVVDGDLLNVYRSGAKRDVQSTSSYRYFPLSAGSTTYAKTALWLHTMERWLGWPTLQRILSTYFERWRFGHPKPHDFFDAATAAAGRDLGWFFDQTYRSSNAFDYGVQDLQTVRDGSGYRTSVVVRRYGEAIFPVDVRVTFRDRRHATAHWNGTDRWTAFTFERPSAAVSAVVDPNRVLLLDVNRTNNSRTLEPQGPRAATRWSLRWMIWLEDALLSWASLA